MLYNIISNIRLGLKHKKLIVITKNTKYKRAILSALWEEKLINGFFIKNNMLFILLKYNSWNESNIKRITLMSKPGKRQYLPLYKFKNFKKSNLIFFLNTTKGVLSLKRALNLKLGGELLFYITI